MQELEFTGRRIKGQDVTQLRSQINIKKQRLQWMQDAIDNEEEGDSCKFYPDQQNIKKHKKEIEIMERKLTILATKREQSEKKGKS